MAKAVAELDLDATGLSRGAKQAEDAFNRVAKADANYKREASKKVNDGLGDRTRRINETRKANEGLFASERKVKSNLTGLVQELSGVSTVSQGASVAITRLSETMRIGFSAAVGVAVGSVINETITKSADKLNELSDKWQEILKVDTKGSSDSALITNLQRAVELIKQADKEAEGLGNKMTGASAQFEAMSSSADVMRGQISKEIVRRADRGALQSGQLQLGQDEELATDKLRERRDEAVESVGEMGLNPADADKVRKAIIRDFKYQETKLWQDLQDSHAAVIQKAEQASKNAEATEKSAISDPVTNQRRSLANQRLFAETKESAAAVAAANKPFSLEAQMNYSAAAADARRARGDVTNFDFSRAVNPQTGNLRSNGSRLAEANTNRRLRKNLEKSRKKFDETGGLVGTLRRDSSGNVIGGIDPNTGESVSRSPGQSFGQFNPSLPDDRSGFAFTKGAAEQRDSGGKTAMDDISKKLDSIDTTISAWAKDK